MRRPASPGASRGGQRDDVIPLAVLWEAIASDSTRTVAEPEALAASVSVDGYQWEAGTLDSPRARPKITYLIGLPVCSDRRPY